jgi:hypothetical protein
MSPVPSDRELIDFVLREARLIDQGRYEEWLELFADDGVTPVALSTGGQYAAPPGVLSEIGGAPTLCDPTFTLVQPVAAA